MSYFIPGDSHSRADFGGLGGAKARDFETEWALGSRKANETNEEGKKHA